MAKKLINKNKLKLIELIISTIIVLVFAFFDYTGTNTIEKENLPDLPQGDFNDVEIISVYDGDTFKVNLPCQDKTLCTKLSVRVRGIDCPEIKGETKKEKKLAQKAKKFTRQFLAQGQVNLENCGKDKYFRLLCDVKVNGGDLAQALLEADLAYPYEGGKKSDKFR